MSDSFAQVWPWLALAALAVLVYLAARRMAPAKLPYQRRASLLTPAERKFYRVLQGAVLGDWPIFAMVRLADLIQVKAQTRNFRKWFNPIVAKHIDFVLCDPETLEPRLAIELDDATHDTPKRIERDQLVNAALAAAGLPLLRVRVAGSYDLAELRKAVGAHLG
jgi:hypothetical protein